VIDPSCEPAVATLAQLALQKSEIEVAIGWFEKQVDLARGEGEIVAALTYLEVRSFISFSFFLVRRVETDAKNAKIK